jgi:hypothetical protein
VRSMKMRVVSEGIAMVMGLSFLAVSEGCDALVCLAQ